MKSSGNKRRRIRHQTWCLKRDRKLRDRKRFGRRGPSRFVLWITPNEYTEKSIQRTADHRVIIRLPEALNFDDEYEATVSHFDIVRRASKCGGRLASLRFDKLKHISPSAALVLASEVDRWNQRRGRRLKAKVETWHEQIRELLQQMGYFELLNIEAPSTPIVKGDLTFLPFKRGAPEDKNNGELAQQLRVEIEAMVGFSIKKVLLFEGLSEAITNVGQHAYPDGSYGMKQWWVSASYCRKDRRLCVIFYDQGIGIPATLPSSALVEHIKQFVSSWADSKKIEAAMEVGRSSTGSDERGKGLQNLIWFAKAYTEGRLSIYSSRGLYRFLVQGQAPNQVQQTLTKDFVNSINGTLIEWSVKL